MRMIPRPIYHIQFFNLIIRFYTVLSSGQQNTVLEMGENDHFDSFQMNDCLSITTTSCGDCKKSPVDQLIINKTRESWLKNQKII